MANVTISFEAPEEDAAALAVYVSEHSVNRSALLRKLLGDFLKAVGK